MYVYFTAKFVNSYTIYNSLSRKSNTTSYDFTAQNTSDYLFSGECFLSFWSMVRESEREKDIYVSGAIDELPYFIRILQITDV